MPQVTIPTIKWGKRKQRSQMCELFTEDGRIVNIELDVLLSGMIDETSGQAFIIDAINQFVNSEDRNWTQLVWERSCLPPSMISDSQVVDLRKLVNQIFVETKKMKKMEQFGKAGKDLMAIRITWIVAIVCTAAVVIAGMQWLGG